MHLLARTCRKEGLGSNNPLILTKEISDGGLTKCWYQGCKQLCNGKQQYKLARASWLNMHALPQHQREQRRAFAGRDNCRPLIIVVRETLRLAGKRSTTGKILLGRDQNVEATLTAATDTEALPLSPLEDWWDSSEKDCDWSVTPLEIVPRNLNAKYASSDMPASPAMKSAG